MLTGPALTWSIASAAALGVVLLLHMGTLWAARRLTRRSAFAQDLLGRTANPTRFVLAATVTMLTMATAPIDAGLRGVVRHGLALALIAGVGWLVLRVSFSLEDLALRRFRFDVVDNLRARKVHTQVRVLRRLTTVMVVIITAGAMMMTFGRVRALGASLLASAGIAGLAAGVAARSTLGNVVAGIQIAFTEPIRLDDVIVVEGQWGRVEEITLTYVVVRLWDLRRLVLPISHFIEKPFENWTRTTSTLLATVEISTDYTVPVDEVRRELVRILDASDFWDQDVWTLQVTGADDRTITLRALMSAPDAPTAWELRCEVREKLIGYLQRHHPAALPRTRAELRNSEPFTIRQRGEEADQTPVDESGFGPRR